LLEVDKINVYYGDLQILHDISFFLNDGEIFAIVGPNCAGKTTLLKSLTGMVQSRSGRITFMGKRIDRMPTHEIIKLGISTVPEGRMLFYDMSVLENLYMGDYLKKVKNRKDYLKWIFELFPVLEERKHQLAKTLSGGEQQMLAIARALMSKPRLLLIDEPSLGLAPLIIKRIYEIIKQLNKEGLSILLIEQNVHLALTLAGRAIVLENGRIVLEGKGKELLESDHVRKAYLGI
jgi:branched-chain amino acid transport system ATP-binding protein